MLRNVMKGVVISLLVTIVMVVCVSLFMLFKEITPKGFNTTWVVITCIAIVVGGVIASKANDEKGWLVGLLLAIVYFIILMIVSTIFNGFNFGMGDFLRLLITMVIGVLSGMLGINL